MGGRFGGLAGDSPGVGVAVQLLMGGALSMPQSVGIAAALVMLRSSPKLGAFFIA